MLRTQEVIGLRPRSELLAQKEFASVYVDCQGQVVRVVGVHGCCKFVCHRIDCGEHGAPQIECVYERIIERNGCQIGVCGWGGREYEHEGCDRDAVSKSHTIE